MKKHNRRHTLCPIEPLEPRIAPALLVVGGNLLGGAGNPTTGETSIGENTLTIIRVLAGQAVAWFDGEHINGISVGPNVKLELTGNIGYKLPIAAGVSEFVYGDIVANLGASGRLSDADGNPADGEEGDALLPNNILGIQTFPLQDEDGAIGHIITGGSVANLNIHGQLMGVYAGDGAYRTDPRDGLLPAIPARPSGGGAINFVLPEMNTNPVEPGMEGGFTLPRASAIMQPGATIKTATIAEAYELQMFAGDGGPTGAAAAGAAPAGGVIENITIVGGSSLRGDATFHLYAGDGGHGAVGGAGGSVRNITDQGTVGTALLRGGAGGNGSAGAGGAGGSVSMLDLQSNGTGYTLTGGAGGSGVPGGAGGSVLTNNAANDILNPGLVVTGDFTGDGVNDVMLIDGITGRMRLEAGNASGTGFSPVLQDAYRQELIYTIPSLGREPVDAVAVDFNNDSRLDLIVAYKDGNKLGVFLNKDGEGHFLDRSRYHWRLEPPVDPLKNSTVGLPFSPRQIAVGEYLVEAGVTAALDIVVIGDEGNHSTATLGKGIVDTDTGVRSLQFPAEPNKFHETYGFGVALVGGNAGKPLLAFQNGDVVALVPTQLPKQPIFGNNPPTVGAFGVGLASLDMNDAGDQLLVVQGHTQMLSVFSVAPATGVLTPLTQIDLSGSVGRPLSARFVDDPDSDQDAIGVLFELGDGARFDVYESAAPPTAPVFAIARTLGSTMPLKSFVFMKSTGDFGAVATTSSFGRFLFTQNFGSFDEFTTPFAGKQLFAYGGDGGDGINTARLVGAGGAGGRIYSLNADASDIRLEAGDGGGSVTGPAGAGGTIGNPKEFVPFHGTKLAPQLLADTALYLEGGDGGSVSLAAAGSRVAAGGAGGGISGLEMTLRSGTNIQILGGDGGDGKGAAGGSGGSISSIVAKALDAGLNVLAGDGGDATAGLVAGGAGGGILSFNYRLELGPEAEKLEKNYDIAVAGGNGGVSAAGNGGAGGNISLVNLFLDPADQTIDDYRAEPPEADRLFDSTVRVSVMAGDGGQGAGGGAGGGVSQITSSSWFDQRDSSNLLLLNYVVAAVEAGDGGQGVAGNGGAGGSIATAKFVGLTQFDEDSDEVLVFGYPFMNPLTVAAGDGGNGSARGGNGGAIAGVTTHNATAAAGSLLRGLQLDGAILIAGDGGQGGTSDGGIGGNIATSTVAVLHQPLIARAGDGGDGGRSVGATAGKGGAGGSILTSTLGSVNPSFNVGVNATAGDGGDGIAGGGAGGAITTINLNAAQIGDYDAALFYAGDGGAASAAAALGGNGGNITGVTQTKDITSAISVLQAGNGGASPLGRAGNGGNVTSVSTVGYIGKPSDDTTRLGAFDNLGFAQGVFAGRGGTGATVGVAGSVSIITARQISAIAAAPDVNGLFAPATSVSRINAYLIGYDVDADGVWDHQAGVGTSPSAVVPIDGFILARVVQSITGLRPFVFNA